MRDALPLNDPLDREPGMLGKFHPAIIVGVGGAIGTSLRHLIAESTPALQGIPLGIIAVNLSGSFFLGLLLEILALRGSDTGSRKFSRLLLGTGLIGGYTTYSTLAFDTFALLSEGHPVRGICYALGTVLFGAACSAAGIAIGRRFARAPEEADL